jgi:hypothetical protein
MCPLYGLYMTSICLFTVFNLSITQKQYINENYDYGLLKGTFKYSAVPIASCLPIESMLSLTQTASS